METPHVDARPRYLRQLAERPRRLRRAEWVRALVREQVLVVHDLIWPVFVVEGDGVRESIAALPGVSRLSVDQLLVDARRARALGVPAVAVFPVVPDTQKDDLGTRAIDPNGLACRAARALSESVPGLGIIGDIALDPYTSQGHDGIFRDGDVVNDETVEVLARMAVVHAQAGFDVVAPSDMMDGRVGAIRAALDAAGLERTLILSYAAKYASAFYGPFRQAVGSARPSGSVDKRTYQMDPANAREALREVALDLEEGADLVMVKPGLPYLDVIRQVKDRFGAPTLAYQVSGEYAMLRAGADAGAFSWPDALWESLLAFKRAGADAIVTYAALEIAERLGTEQAASRS
jgi:porphobilinogen synthase